MSKLEQAGDSTTASPGCAQARRRVAPRRPSSRRARPARTPRERRLRSCRRPRRSARRARPTARQRRGQRRVGAALVAPAGDQHDRAREAVERRDDRADVGALRVVVVATPPASATSSMRCGSGRNASSAAARLGRRRAGQARSPAAPPARWPGCGGRPAGQRAPGSARARRPAGARTSASPSSAAALARAARVDGEAERARLAQSLAGAHRPADRRR